MRPLDRLSDYLGAVERRLRVLAVTRGIAAIAGLALALTVVAVLIANQFAFSGASVIGARVFLFLGIAFAIAAALIVPVIRLNRRHAARKAETRFPEFEERLLTFTERAESHPGDPFLELLAADTLNVAAQAEPQHVARNSWVFGFSGAAVVSTLVLVWLATSGPGFLGYGTNLLWAGLPKGVNKPFYSIQVDPGNRTVRKRSDQMISAKLMGFAAPKVRFFAKYGSASAWEQAEMATEAGGTSYQFLIAGVPETLEYYVEAGGVKSQTFKLNVVDLPAVKNVRVTYHFPAWLGIKDGVEDPGGDLRAVEGTKADVEVRTDRPLSSGVLMLDDGSRLSLKPNTNGILMATVPINKDGVYHIAALEGGEDVRLSEDYFIEAQKDRPPEIKITRPGRDFRASPIEEVTIQVEAKDDFGLKNVDLHYSVNGGPDKTVSMAQAGAKTSTGTTLISLEDYKLEPGDVVSLYATAKDARITEKTDIYFIETQPFEKNFTQSQQAGGGGGGGDDEQQNQISQRQKEIIAATWNQIKGNTAKGTDGETASFLSSVQSKLRDQAKSLADRMKARQLTQEGDSFKSFTKDMEQAVEAMGPASEKLKTGKWQDALPLEQKALQHIMRAEATFRDIQVAFGNQGGGGGGGGGASRDLEGLFDLELDTEKNQYESSRASNQAGGQQQQQVDEIQQKLQQLARRQQELADQQKKGQQQTSQQRWQQEMLRREAEQLRQQLEQMQRNAQQGQLSRNQQGQQSQGQQSQSQQGQSGQSQSGQQSSQTQNGQPNGQMQQGQQNQQQRQQQQQQQQMQQNGQQPRGADPKQLAQMLDRMNQALDDMRDATSNANAGTPQGEAQARRAAERLKEAQQMMAGMRSQESSNQVEELARQAEDLARRQQELENKVRRAYGGREGQEPNREQAQQLAGEQESEIQDLKRMEQNLQSAVRDLQSNQPKAATKLRETLAEMQQVEIGRHMQRDADYIRRGMGQYAVMNEAAITQALSELRDQIRQAQGQMTAGQDGKGGQQGDKSAEQALASVEQMRRMMEQMQARAQQGQRGQQNLQRGQQQNGQNGQQQNGQQNGQQQNGQNGQSGQQQNGQQAGSQSGGQQQGNQPGQQQGGNQPGSPQQGQNPQGSLGPQGGGNPGNMGMHNGYQNGNPYGGPGAYTGFDDPRNSAPVRPEDFQRAYNDTMRNLKLLEQQQGATDPAMARDLQNLMREMQRLNPYTYANDPLLAQRINQALMGNVQQLEMELRRKVEEANGTGSVRSPGSERVPAGYADKVAEYYRKLGKSK